MALFSEQVGAALKRFKLQKLVAYRLFFDADWRGLDADLTPIDADSFWSAPQLTAGKSQLIDPAT
ncbi:MAG: hypothetical protein EAZ30_05025 [Betaproteobacteria bacterium]|nr:MAG: hypothetical protein EAZ30_05025 [Betaproteobacteria bacterium]